MKDEENKIRRRKNNKKELTFNLGIKVGDWFEDISGHELGLKDFYMVKSFNQTSVRLVEIGTEDGELSEVLCGDYDIKNFKKENNILKYDHLKLKKIGEDEARNRLRKIKGVSIILECFGVDQRKVSSQNPSSTQLTTPENKPAGDLDIKVGDYYHCSRSPYINYSSSKEYYIRITSVSHLDIGTRYDKYSIIGDGFNYIVENGIPKELKESVIAQKWTFRITKTGIKGGQKITKEEYDEKLRKIKHQLQPETKPTNDSLSKKRIEEPKKKEKLNLKVGDWFKDRDALLDDPTLYYVSSIGTHVVFTYIHLSGSLIETGYKTCTNDELKQSDTDLILTDLDSNSSTTLIPISDKTTYTILKCCNRDLCYILDCFNLQSQLVSSEETKLETSASEQKKENNLSKNCGQLWRRFKDFEGKYIKFYDGYGIQYLKVREVDYDSENYEFHISGFGPYLRKGTHDGWTNYVLDKKTILQGYLLQAQEISKEEFKKAKEMLKSSHEKTVRDFLEKDKKLLTDLVGKYLKFSTQDRRMGTEYFRLKDIQKETYGDYQCCNLRYENNRFSVNKKGRITYLTGENIQDSISLESFKDAVIITEEEFNKARSGEGFKKQEKPIKIYTKEELKSSILKYTSPDGSIYYLEHPEIPEVGIENKTGKFKNCVVSYGIMISNGGQVHLYTPRINPFNPIVLLIESESDEGFFSRVEKISDHEWASLKKFYRDKIAKI